MTEHIKSIVCCNIFMKLPISAQALYFHLLARADDDGYVNNPTKIQKNVGISDDDLKLLAIKKFIIPFEHGVIIIMNCKMHKCISNMQCEVFDYQPVIKSKNKIDYNLIVEKFNSICVSLPKVTILSEKRKKAMNKILIKDSMITIEQLDELFLKVEKSDFLTGKTSPWKANFDWIMNSTNMAKVIDGNYDNSSNLPKIEGTNPANYNNHNILEKIEKDNMDKYADVDLDEMFEKMGIDNERL